MSAKEPLSLLNTFVQILFFFFFLPRCYLPVITRGLIGMTSKVRTLVGEDVPKTQDCLTCLKEE